MQLLRAPERPVRTWTLDSERWEDYVPAPGDIVIATAPKCGTTWMQQIVSALVFQDDAVRALPLVCPWIERRFGFAAIEPGTEAAATPRGMFKSHLPADALPIYDQVDYIHVARDGRDAHLSMHNHFTSFTEARFAEFDAIGLSDPAIARPYPRISRDPRTYFRQWLTTPVVPGDEEGLPEPSFFELEKSWWRERARRNVLLVHYSDLHANLDSEMRRIAAFLRITVDEAVWPRLVASAAFERMKRNGKVLMPMADTALQGGAERFFHKGANRRWEGLLTPEDLAMYDAKVRAKFTPALARWVEGGRAAAGNPALIPADRADAPDRGGGSRSAAEGG